MAGRGLLGLLGEDVQTRAWVAYLDGLGKPDFEVTLPEADELPAVLLDLAVPHEDIGDLVAARPDRRRSPWVWWLLERCTHALVGRMGALDAPPAGPVLPERLGPLRRYFYVYVLLAALPRVRAFHQSRGIDPDVSRHTLADLGRLMAGHRRRAGVGGFDAVSWLALHFRGTIYQLGRLQFQRARLGQRTGQAVAAAGLPWRRGDPVLAVHVPACFGPLSPRACDSSFARAGQFFARHFPEERYGLVVCHSWLLDPQLAEYLPAQSNIIRFQHRFRPAHATEPEDEVILRFVFGRSAPALDELPQRTRLERAVVAHLRAGRHWHTGHGFATL